MRYNKRTSNFKMRRNPSLPALFSIGTKYVLERNGSRVRRYIEYPNGRRVKLSDRKALTCGPRQEFSIVPDIDEAVNDDPSLIGA